MSFPSSLVGFLGFHPYMCLFSFRKLFCDLFLLGFFVLLFGNGKTEESCMGGEAKGKMHGGKYDNILIKLRIIIKLPVNPNIKLSLSIGGFEVRAKPQASYIKFKAHGFYKGLHAGL